MSSVCVTECLRLRSIYYLYCTVVREERGPDGGKKRGSWQRSIDLGRKRGGPFTLTFNWKNRLFLWGNHLFYGRCLLVIKGLKRLSKVSEITLVTKLGPRQLTFSAKMQQRIRRDAFFTKWRSYKLFAWCVSKFKLGHFLVCKGA